jgi:hypothetical protein
MSQRYYSSVAIPNSIGNSGGLSSFGTSLILAAVPSGYPSQYPFTLRVDPNTSLEELVEVESGSGTTSSPYVITRGIDGTSAKAHNQYATVSHGMSARDLQEPNNHIQDLGNHSGVSPNPHGLDNTVWTAAGSDWSSYTPGWTGTVSNPSVGNGALYGFWTKLGKTVNFNMALALGSTSTLGSGFWQFTLPTTAASSLQSGTALAQPSGGNTLAQWVISSTNLSQVFVYLTSSSSAISSSTPGGWVSGSTLILTGMYHSL